MLPAKRPPTHPGEVLEEEFLRPLGMTQRELAKKMGLDHVQAVNVLVRGRRAVTAHTAILLARAFDTTPEFWMNLQTSYDLWHAQREHDRKRA
jgi:addiction module HigA family antidote